MQLSEIGHMAEKFRREIPDHFPFVIWDEFVVMPNHIHGIMMISKTIDDDCSPVQGIVLYLPYLRNPVFEIRENIQFHLLLDRLNWLLPNMHDKSMPVLRGSPVFIIISLGTTNHLNGLQNIFRRTHKNG